MSDLPESMDQGARHVLHAELLHDLRTPLGHIMGYAELLIEEMTEAGHEEFIPHLEKIRTASRHLLGLMNANFQSK